MSNENIAVVDKTVQLNAAQLQLDIAVLKVQLALSDIKVAAVEAEYAALQHELQQYILKCLRAREPKSTEDV
jgi:predicted RecB family endonuclease